MQDPYESRLVREADAQLLEEITTQRRHMTNGSKIDWENADKTAQNFVHGDGKVQGLEIARRVIADVYDSMTGKPKKTERA